ncbi:MAG: GGDEF domain-containing protein [Acidimicrobiales bacterium]
MVWPTDLSPGALRQAAFLFAAAGFIGLVNDVVPGDANWGRAWSGILDGVAVVIGAVVWLLRNEESLLRPLAYASAFIAYALVGLNNVVGALPPATLGIWFVLVAVCVGSWLPRGTVLLSSPFMTLAYVLPLEFGAPRSHDDLLAATLVVPLAVLSGEIVAANSASLHEAHAAQKQLLGELTRQSTTDPLTSLGNRRFGDVLLDSLAPGDAIAVLDLDRLKVVNDTYGHRRGDEELKRFGKYLLANLRENDAVARFGGDEFILVMQKAAADGQEVVSRLVDGWRLSNPQTTLSAGVAIHAVGVSPELTYSDADRALYSAKHDGGGRCALASPRQANPTINQTGLSGPTRESLAADAS